MTPDPIFQPFVFRNLTLKNRILRSSLAGRFDNPDGSGTDTRIRFELQFARNDVAALISSVTAVNNRGRVIPEFATICHPDAVRFWRKLGKYVHAAGSKYILQLTHAGRQRDIAGIEYPIGLSSTDKSDSINGFPCERMTVAQIKQVADDFGVGAARVREAGLDGVELHMANGYLVSQFLSSAINDREDEYGGPLENRYRFAQEIMQAVRRSVGSDFHVQVKYSVADYGDALFPWEPSGNTAEEGVQIAKWLERDGADGLHLASGNFFPHPRQPPGPFPTSTAARTFATIASEGKRTHLNYIMLKTWPINKAFDWAWLRTVRDPGQWQGINLPLSAMVKKEVSIPVICTGGFQNASFIREAITSGQCDAVSIARALLANPDLVLRFRRGEEQAPQPCTYCNKCLCELLQNPTACYEESRFVQTGGREEMLRRVFAIYGPGGHLPEEPDGTLAANN